MATTPLLISPLWILALFTCSRFRPLYTIIAKLRYVVLHHKHSSCSERGIILDREKVMTRSGEVAVDMAPFRYIYKYADFKSLTQINILMYMAVDTADSDVDGSGVSSYKRQDSQAGLPDPLRPPKTRLAYSKSSSATMTIPL